MPPMLQSPKRHVFFMFCESGDLRGRRYSSIRLKASFRPTKSGFGEYWASIKQGRWAFLVSRIRSPFVEIRRKWDGSLNCAGDDSAGLVEAELELLNLRRRSFPVEELTYLPFALSSGSTGARFKGFRGFETRGFDAVLPATVFPSFSESLLELGAICWADRSHTCQVLKERAEILLPNMLHLWARITYKARDAQDVHQGGALHWRK
jgi:hypothetical protein